MDKINTIAHKKHKTSIWLFLFFLMSMAFVSLLTKAQSPGNLSTSLAFWVKANANVYSDAGTTLCADGNSVQQWSDLSGNTRNATQATAANKPTYKNNSSDNINYNPVISFVGSAQSMATSDYMTMTSNGCLSTGNNPYSVYLVVRPGTYGAGTTPGKILASGACTGANDEFLSFDLRATYAVNDSWDGHDNITTSNKFTANQPFILSFIYKNTVTKRRETFLNGTSQIFTSGAGVGANRNNTNTNNAIGCQFSCSNEFYNGTIAEIASYTVDHTTAQKSQIESYLAVKYGITLGGNGGTSNYVNSSGAVIWTGSASYNYDIVALGKESTNEGLDQKKSVTSNGTVTVPNDVIILANGEAAGTFASPASMTNDGDYLLTGHNNGALATLTASVFTHSSISFAFKSNRIWKAQKTGSPAGNFFVQIDMSRINAGLTLNNKVALLIDDNTTLGQGAAAEKKYLPATGYSAIGGTLTFTIPYSDLGATSYFTVGVAASALPIELVSFDVFSKENKAHLSWKTAAEINNSHFIVKKSASGIHFDQIAVIPGSGNSSITRNYEYEDNIEQRRVIYYQLYQVDFDGKEQLVGTSAVTNELKKETKLKIYPQPITGNSLNYELSSDIAYDSQIELYSPSGQIIKKQDISLLQGTNSMNLDISGLENGLYFIRLPNNDQSSYLQEKVIVMR